MLLGSWEKERQVEREPSHPTAGQVLGHCPVGRAMWVVEPPSSLTVPCCPETAF